ncbi:hypothetical protein [Pedobacter jeongneungensis]|uniref:hypothetical protein n=1 Tax=Pedobacter jeongneungensis TaxID=947309 RepID=UPI0013B3E06E|nr:hypothetical protein [Pedobacter jeongneungensis]
MNQKEQMIDPDVLGQRLLTLRKYYSKNVLNLDKDISQTELAQKCGLNQNKIHQLEFGGKGRIESFISLLNFYISNGFNPLWIVTPDNGEISLYTAIEEVTDEIMEPADEDESANYYADQIVEEERKKTEFFEAMEANFNRIFG